MDKALTTIFFDGLHETQGEAMSALLDALQKNKKAVLVDAPTRFGKTVLYWRLLNGLYKVDALPRVLIMVPTRSLRGQSLDDGLIFANNLFESNKVQEIKSQQEAKASTADVMVMTQSMMGMLQKEDPNFLKRFGLIIEDEAHLDLSTTRQANLSSVDAIRIALTATSRYSHTKNLQSAGYELIYHISIQEAVYRGVISPVRNVFVELLGVKQSLDDLPVVGGDFEPAHLSDYMLKNGVFALGAQLFVASARAELEAGRKPHIAMGFLNRVTSAREAARAFNDEWRRKMADFPQYNMDAFWTNAPPEVEAWFVTNDLKDEVGPVAAAVWADGMPDYVRNYLVSAHRSGDLLFMPSVNVLMHGYTNTLVTDIHNLEPSLSGVTVGQRAGRALGYLPNKEATIYDYIYPGIRNPGLTYGRWAGGFVFRGAPDKDALNSPGSDHSLQPLLDVPNLRIISDEKEVLRYDRDATLLAAASRRYNLQSYLRPIAVAMVKANLTSQDRFLAVARKRNREIGLLDDMHWRSGTTRTRILATLKGDDEGEPTDHHGYTPAAILIAVTLNTTPNELFGISPGPLTAFARNTDGILRRTQQAYIDNVNDEVEPELYPYRNEGDEGIALDHPEVMRSRAEGDIFKSLDADEVTLLNERNTTIRDALSKLSPREERVVRMYAGIGCEEKNLGEIGSELNLTRERIRQILMKALLRLRMNAHSVRQDADFTRNAQKLFNSNGPGSAGSIAVSKSIRTPRQFAHLDPFHPEANTPRELAAKLNEVIEVLALIKDKPLEEIPDHIRARDPAEFSKVSWSVLQTFATDMEFALAVAVEAERRLPYLKDWPHQIRLARMQAHHGFDTINSHIKDLCSTNYDNRDKGYFDSLKAELMKERDDCESVDDWRRGTYLTVETRCRDACEALELQIQRPSQLVETTRYRIKQHITSLQAAWPAHVERAREAARMARAGEPAIKDSTKEGEQARDEVKSESCPSVGAPGIVSATREPTGATPEIAAVITEITSPSLTPARRDDFSYAKHIRPSLNDFV